jgi:hypothetical protein
MVAAVLLVIPLAANAQEELDATYVASDNSFSFDYPGTWLTSEDDEEGTVMIFDGEQFVVLYSPAVLASYGLGDLTDPEDAASLLLSSLEADYDVGKVEVFSMEGRDAARFLYGDDEISGMYLFITFNDGSLGMVNALTEAKLDVFTVQAIAVTFDGGSGGGASGSALFLTEYDGDYDDVVDELRGLGLVDSLRGDLVFTEDYAWFEGQGSFYTPLARRTDRDNFVMSAELTYRPSDATDLETCTLGMHVVWTGNSANEYLDVGYTNFGTIFWWDISDGEDLIYDEVGGPDVDDPHIFTIVVQDGELTVFVDGELVFYQAEVEDRAGSWGVGLTGQGPTAKCEARDIWVFDLP